MRQLNNSVQRLSRCAERIDPLFDRRVINQRRGVMRRVDAVGEPDEVFDRICSALDDLNQPSEGGKRKPTLFQRIRAVFEED